MKAIQIILLVVCLVCLVRSDPIDADSTAAIPDSNDAETKVDENETTTTTTTIPVPQKGK